MAFFNKRMILLFTNLFLLAGIGTTIANYSTSLIQGEAATSSGVVSTRTSALINSSNFSHQIFEFAVNADSAKNYAKLQTTNYFQTNNGFFGSNSPSSIKIVSLQLGTFGTWTGAKTVNFTLTLTNEGTKLTDVGAIDSYTSSALSNSVDGSNGLFTNITSLSIESTSGFTFDGFRLELSTITSTTSGYLRMARFDYEYQYTSIAESEAENYSSNFLLTTDNKQNLCDSVNLDWSTLESNYNSLSLDAKNEFKTNSTIQTIIDARARYNYLISFNNTLNDFVFSV
ncbi:MAG: hypothetical protein ACO22H_04790 [Bacilli bacterium]